MLVWQPAATVFFRYKRRMHIVHVSRWKLPVQAYGGVPRVVYWLAQAQVRQGDRVTILGPAGTSCPGATCIPVGVPRGEPDYSPYIGPLLPADADVVHFHHRPSQPPALPWVLTSHGNSPDELTPLPNKIFVSRNHAERAGSTRFVHNGLDPAEFRFRDCKDDYILFLSKVSRPSKGVDVALQLARDLGFRLVVAGGTRFGLRKTGGLWNSLRAGVHFIGEVDGERKADVLAGARALLFPIRWDEPFGLVVTEALVSGTPVITTPRGSMPELITPEVGFLCDSYAALADAIGRIGEIQPEACRRRVLDHFTNVQSAQAYRRYYEAEIAAWRRSPLSPVDPPAQGSSLAR
jgi:glycosyltransferase involved in cell wall biosynthesis